MERIDEPTGIKRGGSGRGLDPVEPVWRVLLYALRDKGPMTGIQLADAVDLMPGYPRQRRAARVNGVFHYANKRHGEVAWTAGIVRSEYHNVPTHVWDITDRGRELIEQPWPPAPSAKAVRMAAIAARRAAQAARAVRIADYAAERNWGNGQPATLAGRREAAAELRAMGASLQQIGDVFGVSREQARLDLLPGSQRGGNAKLLSRRANMMAALQSPEVTGVLQMLDSEGGSVEDLADAIVNAQHRLRYHPAV